MIVFTNVLTIRTLDRMICLKLYDLNGIKLYNTCGFFFICINGP